MNNGKKKTQKDKKSCDPIADSTMSLGDHLEELRVRMILAIVGLVAGGAICLIFGSRIIAFMERPYTAVIGQENRLQALAPIDGFVTYLKIGLISGLILSSPWVFHQLWMFVAAGLYPHEKRYVYLVAPFSAALFVTGALFFMLAIAPAALRFLIGFNKNVLGVSSNFTFKDYVSFVSTLMLVFGLAFQTPLAVFFLTRTGIVSIQTMRESRKYFLVLAFVVGAVATPGPDPFSQIALAIPMYLLFELGMLLSYLAGRKKKKRTQNDQQ
jgi:sec-independent protein translocase protein TatC